MPIKAAEAILMEEIMEHLVHLMEKCRLLWMWGQADNRNRECVTARHRSGCLFSCLHIGLHTGTWRNLFNLLFNFLEKLGAVSPIMLASFTACIAEKVYGSMKGNAFNHCQQPPHLGTESY